jgi:peptidyl-prolyl cis-trans isomerase D
MLERIREGAQGPWAMVIIGLIVLSFVFAGVGSYLTSSAPTSVATVNGEEISANELERAYQNQRAQMESQYGEGVSALFSDPTYLEQYRAQILDQLIGDLLLKQHAEALGLRVSDAQVREAIVSLPQFQLGGQFDNDRYLAAIRQAGFQVSEFRDYIRREMTRDQLSRALGASSFALQSAATDLAALEQQTRDAKTLTVNASLFADTVSVTDEEIQIYYDANVAQYDTQERVDVAYVDLNVADLEADVTVSEEQVASYYEENLIAYQTEEVRSVSHILVEFGEDRDAALSRIQGIQSKLQAGESFEALAESDSDDTFSAENGGDLGEISRDMMGEAFEAAAFALSNVGDVSDIVETEFGFHLIKATQIQPSVTSSLDEVRDDIAANLKRDAALDRFFELQAVMAQLAFEVPESLDELASELDTKIKTTGLFTRSNAPTPFGRADLIAQAFSDELLSDQVNSDVIEIDDERVLVMRVNAYEPQRTRALDEVKTQINDTLTAQKAQGAARVWAESVVASLSDETVSADALLNDKGLTWEERSAVARNSSDMGRAMSQALFSLSLDTPENIEVVELGNGDIGVVQLQAVNKAEEITEEVVTQYQQRLASVDSRETITSLIETLRAQADIQIPVVAGE